MTILDLALIIIVIWALLRFVPISPLRENSVVHVVLVLGVCLIVYWLLTGDSPRPHHFFRR
jgi:uncharacterized membrane protein